ncbi:MAG TPA: NCS2 family permease [Candidatus Angelobacter sp.]|jgi:AGZA family xanthine/uracil permease-like MFS transporter|nr:NCS2 family permease [Candidatus Angelobacter sp.]
MTLRPLRTIFRLEQHQTTFSREVIAGLTTFTTMSYIVVVNPAILANAGIPVGPSFVATALAAIFGCVLMGLYANRPFAIAPYMGENAFIAFTVCQVLGYRWQTALAAIFISGALFALMTVLHMRKWLVEAVPQSLRYSFAVGIGLFLTFIGLNQAGIVTLGSAGAPVRSGHLTAKPVMVAIAGFILISVLVIRRIRGAILLGIVLTAALAFVTKTAQTPDHWLSMPPTLRPIFWQLDFAGAFTWRSFPIVFIMFIMAFVDTMGTLIGLSARAGFLDEHGNLPQIERPMLVDALSTCFSASIGTTTSGAFIESATGIEAGGRTGLTALVTAGCFALTLFFAPLVSSIPPQAYGPALIVTGLFMLAPITRIDFSDYTESIPAFAVVALMSFTFNIAVGITAGFVLYPLCKMVGGKGRQIRPALWVLTALSLLFFVFYPYT